MKTFDIHERIFQFVISVLQLIKEFSNTEENKIIKNQIIRSVTSVGANDQEADGVSSKRDFIHCFTVVRKELKETHYWLRVLFALNPTLQIKINSRLQESDELIKIVSTIIGNAALPKKEIS
jgi:four helix bundle protein